MASPLLQAVESIQINDYGSLATLVVVGYDYILTFSDEVEYIWSQSWTKVSWLFVFVRYFGLCAIVWKFFRAWTYRGEILALFSAWATMMFIAGADLVMILRVWAMYGRSKIILGILLAFYAIQMIIFLIACIVLSTPNTLTAVSVQLLDFSFCTIQQEPIIWAEIVDNVQLGLNAFMCLLVAVRFIGKSVQIYRVTKQWDMSCYMNLLAREGVLYFLAILSFTLINVLALTSSIPTSGWQGELATLVQFVPVFTLAPRLILSMRGLYARDLRGGRPRHLDTEFGFSSMSNHGGVMTDLLFAGSQCDQEVDNEGIEVEEMGKRREKSRA